MMNAKKFIASASGAMKTFDNEFVIIATEK